jgi:hypothetical protein
MGSTFIDSKEPRKGHRDQHQRSCSCNRIRRWWQPQHLQQQQKKQEQEL